MASSSADSRPTVPPPFDVARYARDADARVRHPSDEYEIEVDSAIRTSSGVRSTGATSRSSRPTAGPPPGSATGADSVGSLEVFMDSDPVEELLASVEIEIAPAISDHRIHISTPAPSRPRTTSMLPKEALHQVPKLVKGGPGMARIDGLDPRVAFLLSRFDGYSDLETVLDVSGMPTAEAMDILAWLVEQGIVTLSPGV